MDFIKAIILGIVQGITEWLPISSSGHLVIADKLLGSQANIVFDLVLHLGSLAAVLLFFHKDILSIIKAWLKWQSKSYEFKMGLYIIAGSVPIAVIGVIFQDIVEKAFSSIFFVGFAFLINGAILFSTKFAKGKKPLSMKLAVVVGAAQAVALAPGISRSGSTISAGMLAGMDKEKVAKFSFLLGIPAILGAIVFKFWSAAIAPIEIPYILVGFIAAFITGLLALPVLMSIIKKGRFYRFSWYCFALGILVLFLNYASSGGGI